MKVKWTPNTLGHQTVHKVTREPVRPADYLSGHPVLKHFTCRVTIVSVRSPVFSSGHLDIIQITSLPTRSLQYLAPPHSTHQVITAPTPLPCNSLTSSLVPPRHRRSLEVTVLPVTMHSSSAVTSQYIHFKWVIHQYFLKVNGVPY